MSIPSLPAIKAHKAYRIRQTIKQLEKEILTDPSRQPALENFRELLTKLEAQDDKFMETTYGKR